MQTGETSDTGEQTRVDPKQREREADENGRTGVSVFEGETCEAHTNTTPIAAGTTLARDAFHR